MSDSEFSQRLTDVFYFFAQRAVALANLALNGNPHGYEILFLRFMERSTDGNSQQVQNWISQLGLRHLRHMLRDFVTFTASDMRSDLVVVSDEPTDSSETACDAKNEYSADQRKISDGVPGSSSNFGTPMDVQSVVGKSIQQAPSLKVSNAVANQKTDRAKNKSVSGDTFELPTEWQSVILADRERMLKMQPQAPFSHAYESSGEACRATLSTENECINGADLAVRTVTDALNEAINYGNSRTTSLSPPSRVNNDNLDSQLANAMKQSFHDSLLRRLSNDRDFMEEQHKFPELKKFIARE
ncbi:hypothetical protein AB6A40_004114 [Gnathostoma spinigerum]|uniref:Uncharacterized protein n=1 Tax=Gnathostoma spinigerum TaxID=75299 RepID=A0ABD6EBI9_9BILA